MEGSISKEDINMGINSIVDFYENKYSNNKLIKEKNQKVFHLKNIEKIIKHYPNY